MPCSITSELTPPTGRVLSLDRPHKLTIYEENDYDEINIDGERETFEEIADGETGNPYDRLIGSIAPLIKGGGKMENIKLAVPPCPWQHSSQRKIRVRSRSTKSV